MKNFLNFIVEQSRADLYHGTSIDNVHHILKAGKINASDNGRVSLSRNKKYVESGHGEEAYFKINHDTLKHNHKVTPTDWHMGGSVHDKHHEDDMREPEFRRSEAEESVKGHIPLKHVKELVVHKTHYDQLTGPETDNEKEFSHEIKSDPESAWMYKGLTHKDRLKTSKQFHSHLKKHGIKLTVKDY